MALKLSEALDAFQAQVSQGRNLWSLYIVVTGALITVLYSEVGLKTAAEGKWLLALAFAAFAFSNFQAQREAVSLQNGLREELRSLAEQEKLQSRGAKTALSSIRPIPRWGVLGFHLFFDFIVVVAVLRPWEGDLGNLWRILDQFG